MMRPPEHGNAPAANRGVNVQVAEAGNTSNSTSHFVTVAGKSMDLSVIGAGSRNPRGEVFMAGWAEGYESRQAEIDRLNFTADRLYAELCRRTPPKQADPPSYADLEATRTAIYYAGVN